MARVLICEPHPEVRELLRRVVARLGHEPVVEGDGLQDVAAIVLEPAHAPSVETAQAYRAFAGDVPIICASVDLPNGGTNRLDPAAFLVKPFALPDLEGALRVVLGEPQRDLESSSRGRQAAGRRADEGAPAP